MCAAVDATVYDVPLSGAPEQPTDNLHRRSGLQNAFIQPPTMVSSWDDHRPLCASTAVSVDMWLDSALKDVAHHSATTRDHRLLLDKTAGVVVCAQCGTPKCPQ
ncbi:hypothetical protein HPB52_014893 [Rhipicephalus sanguineus]|uniref:Uncharacterized protein n=1 Tax=Rhipicephalus sanguineus TaxID=34632 RepID=A0A9D4SPV3_RHISA|nr:hypothetical protein HPB52_014893 [Rhipicephalus sanguineus]